MPSFVPLSDAAPKLRKQLGDQFNVFFGAGLSRDPPTSAPIWNELQCGFVSSVFNRMAADNWPAARGFDADLEAFTKLAVRPETFWRYILDRYGLDVVHAALQAVGGGRPNANHRALANLLDAGRCPTVVTPNFDEHLDSILPAHVQINVPTAIGSGSKPPGRVSPLKSQFVKVHGTISSAASLAFTLEQYDQLGERNAQRLKMDCGRRPLLIVGYSGLDTDLCPALGALDSQFLAIVKHPGSPSDQPVFDLSRKHAHSILIEASCSQLFQQLVDPPITLAPSRSPSTAQSWSDAVKCAASNLSLPDCASLVMDVLYFVGAFGRAKAYAWLCHDAIADKRYSGALKPGQAARLLRQGAAVLKWCGDVEESRIFLLEAAKLTPNTTNSPDSTATSIGQLSLQREHGLSSNSNALLHNQARFGAAAKLKELIPKAALASGDSGGRAIEMRWQLALALHREGKLGEACRTYASVAALVKTGMVTHVERGHFFLDFGGALYLYAIEKSNGQLLNGAEGALAESKNSATGCGDWRAAAAATLMLARVSVAMGDIAGALKRAADAKAIAERCLDEALCDRIKEFQEYLANQPGGPKVP